MLQSSPVLLSSTNRIDIPPSPASGRAPLVAGLWEAPLQSHQQPQTVAHRPQSRFKALGKLLGWSLAGLGLKLIETLHQENRELQGLARIPTIEHWSYWARLPVGIAVVNQFNQTLNIKPPAWVNALETTGVLTFLIAGFTKTALKNFVKVGAFVAATTAATNALSRYLEPRLEERYHIAPGWTRAGMTVVSMLGGVALYEKGFIGLLKNSGLEKALHLEVAEEVGGGAVGASMVRTCPMGCTPQIPGSPITICMTELTDFASSKLNGMWAGWRHQKQNTPTAVPSPSADASHLARSSSRSRSSKRGFVA